MAKTTTRLNASTWQDDVGEHITRRYNDNACDFDRELQKLDVEIQESESLLNEKITARDFTSDIQMKAH